MQLRLFSWIICYLCCLYVLCLVKSYLDSVLINHESLIHKLSLTCRDYNDGQYDFNYQMDGAQAMWNQYGYMNSKS